MPFREEIVLGDSSADCTADAAADCSFDAGVVFSATDAAGVETPEGRAALGGMVGSSLIKALEMFSAGKKALRYASPSGSWTLATTLDPSQCSAVLAALTRRVCIIQGPPGHFSISRPQAVASHRLVSSFILLPTECLLHERPTLKLQP